MELQSADIALRGALAFTVGNQIPTRSPFERTIEQIFSYRQIHTLRDSQFEKNLGKLTSHDSLVAPLPIQLKILIAINKEDYYLLTSAKIKGGFLVASETLAYRCRITPALKTLYLYDGFQKGCLFFIRQAVRSRMKGTGAGLGNYL